MKIRLHAFEPASRANGPGLRAVVWFLREIECLPLGPNILDRCDVLIAGRYSADKHIGHGLLGSSNQQIHLLSDRYNESQLNETPRCELVIRSDGTITVSGLSPWQRR